MLSFLLAASGELRCAVPANCSEDHVASRRHSGVGGEGTVTAKTSVMRPQDIRHTTHTQTSLTHTRLHGTALPVRKPLSTADHTTMGHKAEDGRPRALCSLTRSALHRNSTPALFQGSLKSTSVLRPQKQTRKKQ